MKNTSSKFPKYRSELKNKFYYLKKFLTGEFQETLSLGIWRKYPRQVPLVGLFIFKFNVKSSNYYTGVRFGLKAFSRYEF